MVRLDTIRAAMAAASVAAIALPQSAEAREIGMVTRLPDASTGELKVDLPARPPGDIVYIIREGQKVATATVKSENVGLGTTIAVGTDEIANVRLGDRISTTPNLDKKDQLPASAYRSETLSKSDRPAASAPPISESSIGAAPSKSIASAAPASASAVSPASALVSAPRNKVTAVPLPATPIASSAKTAKTSGGPSTIVDVPGGGERMVRRQKDADEPQAAGMVVPRLTPRGSEIPLYPAPAIVTQGGFLGPYGAGLAAAAPVGTPYLRSPAFAGPPLIYMPQTVTRVLLPGSTPHPANIMAPPIRYAYSSAPFTRTDIYVNLPYGTYYWPNGYAGTTPVEPQIPAYLTAPATAVLTSEASYTTARYAPGAASAEVVNPITVPPAAAAGTSVITDTGVTKVEAANQSSVKPGGPGVPGPETALVAPGAPVAPAPQAAAVLPPLQPLAPFPTSGTNIPTATPTPIPGPNTSLSPTPGPANPFAPEAVSASLSGTNIAAAGHTQPIGAGTGVSDGSSPFANPTAPATPVNIGPTANSEKPGIIVDDKTPGGIILEPAGDWLPSRNVSDSYDGSSVFAQVDGPVRTATYRANIPESGNYEVFLWWAGSNREFRSTGVPVIINTANGPVQVSIDQTLTNKTFNSLGVYPLKAGPDQPIAQITTKGIEGAAKTVTVSVDALKLVKVQ